jgi:hypothetical protein
VHEFFWGTGLYDSLPKTVDPLWSAEKANLYKEILPLLEGNYGNGGLIISIGSALKGMSESSPKEILYFPWNSSALAAGCASRLKNLHAKSGHPVSISAIGFSLGGYTTVLFARIAKAYGVHLRNVLTFDPVPYTHELFRALKKKPNGTIISAPDNHDSWVNLFQRKDPNSLEVKFGPWPIHGSMVSGAVKNSIPIQGGEEADDHMTLPDTDVGQEEILRLLRD